MGLRVERKRSQSLNGLTGCFDVFAVSVAVVFVPVVFAREDYFFNHFVGGRRRRKKKVRCIVRCTCTMDDDASLCIHVYKCARTHVDKLKGKRGKVICMHTLFIFY